MCFFLKGISTLKNKHQDSVRKLYSGHNFNKLRYYLATINLTIFDILSGFSLRDNIADGEFSIGMLSQSVLRMPNSTSLAGEIYEKTPEAKVFF